MEKLKARNFKISITKYLIILIPIFFSYSIKAQNFGRNKVQYRNFYFKILTTPHFEIYHYPETDSTIFFLANLSETWYNNYSKLFQLNFSYRNPLVIYRNASEFQQTRILPQLIGIGTGGVTEGYKNRVILPLAESWESTNHVLGHELVHAFQYRLFGEIDSIGLRSIGNVPLWMIEGMAEYLSLGSNNTHTSMWMADAVMHDDIPTIDQLNNDYEYFPYRYGHALWSYITGIWGDEIIIKLFKETGRTNLNSAFLKILNVSEDSLSVMWKNELIKTYKPLLYKRSKPENYGKKILSPETNGGKNNVSPSISPNGKWIIYSSEQSIFSFDLFLAETKTGKTIKKLASTTNDAHLNAISFIESTGAWSPDNKLFAFVVFENGTNSIHIIDPFNGKIKKKIENKGIGAISNPKFSPDGRNIVFSGSDGSKTNLYLCDLRTGKIDRLINSKYTNLMPSYSDDGRYIAFITDQNAIQKNKEEGAFVFGSFRPALYDMGSESITLLPYFRDSKHINPLFSFDGSSLYYISDRDGASNIYRLDLKTRLNYQVTNVATGVSGISELSPAMSIADDGTLIYSVFENGNYIVYKLNPDESGGKLIIDNLYEKPGRLPPLNRRGKMIVDNYLNHFDPLIIDEDSIKVKKYRPKFSLDYLANAGIGIGIGAGQLGTAIGGGVAGIFSDMLNNHILYSAIQINGQLKDLGIEFAYLNQKKNLNYGLDLSHIPYTSIFSSLQYDSTKIDGETVIVPTLNQIIQRTFQQNATFFTYYPLNIVKRLEFSLGYTRLSFQRQLLKSYLWGDYVFKEDKKTLPNPKPINIYNTAIAYVGDNSYYGIEAPLKGYRYRFELGLSMGSFTYLTPLIDYRKYIYLKPISFAFRTMEYGRYFKDANNSLLTPFFIGNESLIRGYSIGSFLPSECKDENKNGDCPAFDRLLGNKFGVLNMEIRLPFTGPKEISVIASRYLPISLNAFFDAGIAWSENEKPILKINRFSSQRIPVFSTGLCMRLAVFGYFAVELYYAYPFQRPEKGPHIGLFISPVW